MRAERPLNNALLVTLLCPNCKKRVAVMDHFPNGKETPSDITLIDGSTPKKVDRLACPRCRTTFPPTKAHYPEHVFLRAGLEPPPQNFSSLAP